MHTPIEARFVGGPMDGTVCVLPTRQEAVRFEVLKEPVTGGLVETEIAVYAVASVGQVVTIYAYDHARAVLDQATP